MHPMFTELFVETDAEDLPAEENRGAPAIPPISVPNAWHARIAPDCG